MNADRAAEAALLVLDAVIPVAMLTLAGLIWARRGEAFPTAFVTRLSLTLSLPALLFAALARAEFSAAEALALGGASAAAYLGAAGALALGLRAAGMPLRVWLLPTVNGNTGNLGLPLLLFAFGPEGLAAGVAIFAVQCLLTFSLGLWLMTGRASPGEALGQPVLWAAAAGVAAGLAGWLPPLAAMRGLDLAAQMAIPLMLLTLGVSLAGLRVRGAGRALALSVLRLPVCAAAGWGAALAFGLPPVMAACLVLQMVTPGAVTSFLLAERHGLEPGAVAGFVAVSTALALVTLPAALALLVPV